ncbi:hypothetical protein GOODEAATRI_032378 [Goodea atripinnis]|uniref:Uncharacterized protein n=1 Tax=Goodea atripinnis TaxID=208336 RepID=A0ABV0P9F4_9TELE
MLSTCFWNKFISSKDSRRCYFSSNSLPETKQNRLALKFTLNTKPPSVSAMKQQHVQTLIYVSTSIFDLPFNLQLQPFQSQNFFCFHFQLCPTSLDSSRASSCNFAKRTLMNTCCFE